MGPVRIPNAKHYTASYLARREIWAEAYEAIADVLVARFGRSSVVDVGCAAGHLVEALRRRGLPAMGVDGAPDAPSFWPGEHRSSYIHADLAAPATRLPPTEGVCCLEVAEHLPASVAGRLVSLLLCHRPQWVVFTAAPPGASRDPSHMNEQPYYYWAALFADRGYALDAGLTCSLRVPLRRHGGVPYWYVRNLLAFRPSDSGRWPLEEDWVALERRFLRTDRLQVLAMRQVNLADVDAHLKEAEALLSLTEARFYVDAEGHIVVAPGDA